MREKSILKEVNTFNYNYRSVPRSIININELFTSSSYQSRFYCGGQIDLKYHNKLKQRKQFRANSNHGNSYSVHLVDSNGFFNHPQIPSIVWSPFYLSVEENLINKNGIVNFFHDHLRQAVESRYLPTEEDKRQGYLKLANFFNAQDIDERYVSFRQKRYSFCVLISSIKDRFL